MAIQPGLPHLKGDSSTMPGGGYISDSYVSIDRFFPSEKAARNQRKYLVERRKKQRSMEQTAFLPLGRAWHITGEVRFVPDPCKLPSLSDRLTGCMSTLISSKASLNCQIGDEGHFGETGEGGP